MRKISVLLIILFSSLLVHAQEADSSKAWEFSTDVNAYFLQDDFFMIPVFRADYSALHLEARYNYEDMETFSAWAGYNFSGGGNLEYLFTPMIGVVAGNSNGVAPGLEFTLNYNNFSFTTESEYLFETDSKENNFFYSFNDLSYTIQDKVWFGLSAQRTRIYKTDLDLSGGLLTGGSFRNWELNGYLFNLFIDEPFAILVLSYSF